MSPDLERLITLQKVETAIADAHARIAAHPGQLEAADARLDASRRAVDAVAARQKTNQVDRREAEKHAALFQTRLTRFKDQLSEVKTNREYQAMQHEIATAQNELGAAEEQVLERMVEADGIAADLAAAQRELATHQKEVQAETQRLEQERADAERELAAAAALRTQLMHDMDETLVSLFQHVAKARKGVAVSLATRDGTCSVCHVRLRPPVFQRVRQNDSIVQCEVCQRILYFVPPPPPVEAPAVHTS
jgi:hypothetical protein